MNVRWTHALFITILAAALSTGCAAPSDDASNAPNAGSEPTAESDLTAATDAAIQGKLRGILKDVTFTSEGDFGYLVFEGDTVAKDTKLNTKLVRQKLQAAIKAQSSSKRDILPSSCRSSRLSVNEAIAGGNAVAAPGEEVDPHDKQLSIALKTMRASLKSVVGFTFGTNASGDQDEVGPVVFVYVGVSKTTGKLIAIMTEAVFT